MGIRPLLACDPTFPRDLCGEILCAYLGGRAEVRTRREISEVTYCDFKSMYPTVNGLMGLWQFVIAESVVVKESTKETQAFLDAIEVDDLQRRETWPKLCTLVLVQPNQDAFPVRAAYNGDTYTIGLNYVTTKIVSHGVVYES